ncbi:hypothetical protein [Glutamicibacter sp. TV12E]|uniref:hypothetical protein n=1 Tax=Glutamicibacter sp. TV12E TaxID=3446362 RepID=UPI004033A045
MSFSELKEQNDDANLFKALSAVAFLAPMTAAPITTLIDSTTKEIKALPAEYVAVGLLDESGITFGGDSEESETRSLGYVAATRTDLTSASREVTLTAQEVLKKELMEIAYGIDLSTVTRDATTGELAFDRPELPQYEHYRLVVIAQDGVNKYQARFFPKVKIVSVPEEVWNSEDAQTFELSFRAEVDSALGTNERVFSVIKTA